MSKIELDNITSGFSTQKINANFQKIKNEINNKMLSRDPGTEPNVMLDDLDMNSNRILNLPKPLTLTEPVRLIDIQGLGSGGGTGGGGIVYEEPSTEFVQGITYFNPKTFELVMSYPDGDGEQYITFPLVGSLISYEEGPGEGGTGGGISYTNAKPTTLTVENTYFNPETFELTMTYQDSNSTQYVTFPLQPSTYNIEPGSSITNGTNLGAGTNLFKVKFDDTLQFKTLVPGANVTITSDENTVTIAATGGGGGGTVDTNQNVGATGAGVFKITSANISYFRKIKAGDTTLTVTENTDDIAIVVNNVPYTKINTFPAGSIAGRTSAGAGAIEAISIGSGLALAGGVLSATGGGGTTLNAALTSINALTPSADTLPYYTSGSAAALATFTSIARTILAQATGSQMLSQMGITYNANANGVSLRIPIPGIGGVQICWSSGLTTGAVTTALGSMFLSSDVVWTYPQAFSATPTVVGSAGTGAFSVVGGTSANTASAARVRGAAPVSDAGGATFYLIAIGTY